MKETGEKDRHPDGYKAGPSLGYRGNERTEEQARPSSRQSYQESKHHQPAAPTSQAHQVFVDQPITLSLEF